MDNKAKVYWRDMDSVCFELKIPGPRSIPIPNTFDSDENTSSSDNVDDNNDNVDSFDFDPMDTPVSTTTPVVRTLLNVTTGRNANQQLPHTFDTTFDDCISYLVANMPIVATSSRANTTMSSSVSTPHKDEDDDEPPPLESICDIPDYGNIVVTKFKWHHMKHIAFDRADEILLNKNMRRACFSESKFHNVWFECCILTCSSFCNSSSITASTFKNCDLCDLRFDRDCRVQACTFDACTFDYATNFPPTLTDSTFQNLTLEHVNLHYVKLQNVHFRNVTFAHVIWPNAVVKCTFERTQFDALPATTFEACQFNAVHILSNVMFARNAVLACLETLKAVEPTANALLHYLTSDGPYASKVYDREIAKVLTTIYTRYRTTFNRCTFNAACRFAPNLPLVYFNTCTFAEFGLAALSDRYDANSIEIQWMLKVEPLMVTSTHDYTVERYVPEPSLTQGAPVHFIHAYTDRTTCEAIKAHYLIERIRAASFVIQSRSCTFQHLNANACDLRACTLGGSQFHQLDCRDTKWPTSMQAVNFNANQLFPGPDLRTCIFEDACSLAASNWHACTLPRDLTHTIMRGAILTHCDLAVPIHMSPANIRDGLASDWVHLPGDLCNAKFMGADLSGRDLRAHQLECADFRNACTHNVLWPTVLNGANLSGHDLHTLDMHTASLKSATLVQCTLPLDLSNGVFEMATLHNVKLQARVSELHSASNSNGAKVSRVQLHGTSRTGNINANAMDTQTFAKEVDVAHVFFKLCTIEHLDWHNVQLHHIDFTNATLKHLDFSTQRHLRTCTFEGACISQCQFPRDLTGTNTVNFEGVKFTRIQWLNTQLGATTSFKRAHFVECLFRNDSMDTNTWENVCIQSARFTLCTFDRTIHLPLDLTCVAFEDNDMEYANFVGCNLSLTQWMGPTARIKLPVDLSYTIWDHVTVLAMDFSKCIVAHASFSHLVWTRALKFSTTVQHTSFVHNVIENVDLSAWTGTHLNFAYTTFKNVALPRIVRNYDFSHCNLEDSRFVSTQFCACTFDGARLNGCTFSNCVIDDACTFAGASLVNAYIVPRTANTRCTHAVLLDDDVCSTDVDRRSVLCGSNTIVCTNVEDRVPLTSIVSNYAQYKLKDTTWRAQWSTCLTQYYAGTALPALAIQLGLVANDSIDGAGNVHNAAMTSNQYATIPQFADFDASPALRNLYQLLCTPIIDHAVVRRVIIPAFDVYDWTALRGTCQWARTFVDLMCMHHISWTSVVKVHEHIVKPESMDSGRYPRIAMWHLPRWTCACTNIHCVDIDVLYDFNCLNTDISNALLKVSEHSQVLSLTDLPPALQELRVQKTLHAESGVRTNKLFDRMCSQIAHLPETLCILSSIHSQMQFLHPSPKCWFPKSIAQLELRFPIYDAQFKAYKFADIAEYLPRTLTCLYVHELGFNYAVVTRLVRAFEHLQSCAFHDGISTYAFTSNGRDVANPRFDDAVF